MSQTKTDPWAAASKGRASPDRKKALRLAGNGPDKVHTLIKSHDWRGRAVYVYHLLKKELRVVRKPTSEKWDYFTTTGTAIQYPADDHESADVEFWVKYAKEQAALLSLRVEE